MNLSLPAAATEAGVSEKTLRREISAGALPVIRIRGRVLVSSADLAAYLAARRCQSVPIKENGKPAFSIPTSGLVKLWELYT